MDETDYALFPGMSCRAEIITSQGDATTNVPIAAVQYDNNEPFVWKVQADSVYRTKVSLGMASDTEQAVLGGLEPGDSVVIGPSRTVSQLQEKDKINANTKSAPQEQS
jgi:HlyD family secretion protein